MATPGYPDPITALNAVVACLNMPANVVVHTGSLGSGETIPCCAQGCEGDGCSGGVLRVETGQTTPAPADGSTAPAMIISGRCMAPLRQEIVVNYRECFPSNLGKAATPTTRLTANGLSVVMSWWEALQRIWVCNSTDQQRIRFLNRVDSEPAGQCAGWTLYLEVTLASCAAPIGRGTITAPIGQAGESDT